ncbi:MAG TPA: pyridine nucleotide-disulfide oxidoreductase [Lentisphaeria bacterium]|nr:MAG: pyridine nucleotide-disulfide oxidoreductase [Lentisphaerae bacterium GWF2_50_93]HCE45683.1 pyridine nucleotide-disulfide oxidoreductase [Lentisphaeria bacterium]
MINFKYLIIGGGMTADSAVQGIRQVDPDGSIGMISSEKDKPYNRPPLSKGLWKDKPFEGIWRKTDSMGVKILNGYSAMKIDAVQKQVVDDAENIYSYDKLLLATGGRPRRLPFGGDDIIYFRTAEDYRKLRMLCEKGRKFAVIGGGFIGSEIAAALRLNGKEVIMIFPENGIGDRVFPRGLSEYLNSYYRGKGVEIVAGDIVEGLERKDGRIILITGKRQELLVDGVVAGLGIEPNIELAVQAGIKTGNGIVVDEMLRTNLPDIFAAGDVVEFYNPSLDRRLRVEHEDNANTMGGAAGRGMAGGIEPYYHLPFFYSDMFDLGYEAVGILDSRLETYADWNIPNEKGVIYYIEKERLVGILLWNVWNKIEDARKLISLARFNPKAGIR